MHVCRIFESTVLIARVRMRIVAMEPYTAVHSRSRIRSSRACHLAHLRTTYTKVDFQNASRYVKILKHQPYLLVSCEITACGMTGNVSISCPPTFCIGPHSPEDYQLSYMRAFIIL